MERQGFIAVEEIAAYDKHPESEESFAVYHRREPMEAAHFEMQPVRVQPIREGMEYAGRVTATLPAKHVVRLAVFVDGRDLGLSIEVPQEMASAFPIGALVRVQVVLDDGGN